MNNDWYVVKFDGLYSTGAPGGPADGPGLELTSIQKDAWKTCNRNLAYAHANAWAGELGPGTVVKLRKKTK